MDIGIAFDPATGSADWGFADGDLLLRPDIETAVLVSLFTDRAAQPGYVPADGDKRGWWGDSYSDRPIGSRLWQLDRAKKLGQAPLLLQARDMCDEALKWLVDGGIAARVEVATKWLSRDALGIAVTVTKPDGTAEKPMRFEWAWRGL